MLESVHKGGFSDVGVSENKHQSALNLGGHATFYESIGEGEDFFWMMQFVQGDMDQCVESFGKIRGISLITEFIT